jgi:methionyl-tRNA formyltransferase
VKTRALAAGLPVLQPDRPVGPDFESALRELAPDLGVVVAYGHVLKPAVLGIPRLGMLNVHASLLPRHRGAAPIQHAILEDDAETGITIMQMEAGLDSGPIVHRVATAIAPNETARELTDRLAPLGARALGEALDRIAAHGLVADPQDHSRATYAPKIDRAAARLDWTETAGRCACRIRAFDPVPGAWTTLDGGELKCFRPEVVDGRGPPGTVLAAADRLVVAAGEGAAAIAEVQPAGRQRMPVAAWLRGRATPLGARCA